MKRGFSLLWTILAVLALALFVAAGCRAETDHEDEHAHETADQSEILTLPELASLELEGAPLKVVATTSIIGDVVAQVGGEVIELTTLMGPGQDPHSYQPTPQQMATVARAHVVFVNGWDLEEALTHDLEQIAGDVPLVPISAGIEPRAFGQHKEDEHDEAQDEDEHDHAGPDPHVWFDVGHVKQWAENVARVLGDLDPAHAEIYAQNAETYRAKLDELDAYANSQLVSIPEDRRFLVTNHEALGYLAEAYDLHVLGTVLPAASTVAEPSASLLVALIDTMEEHGLCTLFAETTNSTRLAQAVADELAGCNQVAVLQLYTGAIGPAGSGADSYIGMYRYNVDTIVEGLQ